VSLNDKTASSPMATEGGLAETKGQLISEELVGILNSSKKTNEKIQPTVL
jgi:hypothetical protein